MTSSTAPGASTGDLLRSHEALAAMRADFPGFRIWREDAWGRVRFVARSLRPGLNPHTAVTADLGELRDMLAPASPGTGLLTMFPADEPAPGGPGQGFTPHAVSVARVYDYILGGKDHYPADRAAAESMLGTFPEISHVARASRAFLNRAVRHVAAEGVAQFIDLGAGLPTSPSTHETARQISPGARVAYVDHDPMVLAHASALLTVDDSIAVVAGDLRDPTAIFASPALRSLIDLRQPVCMLLVSVLHFLPAADADAVVAAVKDQMAPGSYLVISAGTSTGTDPALICQVQAAYGDTAQVTGRTEAEITAWFDGLLLARPGLVDVWNWRPDNPRLTRRPPQARARFLAGVALKTASLPRWQP